MLPSRPRPAPPVRPTRRLGKFGYFLTRGITPRKAWWLARHDAVVAADYRRLSSAELQRAWDATGDWAEWLVRDDSLLARRLELPLAGDDVLARGFHVFASLRDRGFTTRREAGLLEVADANLRLRVTNDEQVNMLQEILVEDCYRFHLTGHWHVLDIGGNVGFASLYFASQPWAAHVHAFEPFGPTAEKFDANLTLNPRLRGRITLNRIGLGEDDATSELPYHADLAGSMSVAGLGSWRGSASGPAPTEPIRVRRASAVLDELAPQLGTAPLLAKIDCEGSEYGILRDLERSGWLRRLQVIVMEWHERRPDELVARLAAAGFVQHLRPLVPQQTLGLIIAVRTAPV